MKFEDLENEASESFNQKKKELPLIYLESDRAAYILGWIGNEYERLIKEVAKLKNEKDELYYKNT